MKIGFLSLGCPKNLVDGEVMLGLAEQAGHEITNDASNADVLVVNTCAFIDSAKQESIDAILEMAEQKKSGACRTLIVTGCLGERYREELKREIPEIDVVLGTGEVPEIVSALSGTKGQRSKVREAAAVPLTLYKKPTYLYDAATPRHLSTPRHFAYVKVAEGCDYTCSFCIIPTLRGAYRSRTADSIVTEARNLAARGVKELILISQDTTFYGNDRGERGALARLLRELNGVDGLEWIRLLYLYPTTITDDTLAAMAECEKVCRYVDLPLQHASAAVLERMRRPGNRASYDKLLARIRERVPGVTLRTTFIAGYPGETEAEFDELRAFVRDTEFDHVGVFTYSHEEGTRAYSADDDVTPPVKRRRRDQLMEMQKGIVARAQARRVGQRVRVLVDGPSGEHRLVVQGRLAGQAPEIDPVVFFTESDPDELIPGTFVEGEVVAAREYDLVVSPVLSLVEAPSG
ncbi:MAG: 30S ribosomal protein S12 methylthiotransferase RimO [Acidobacteria bacterium]|nr:30S ribosomal protein S12 methylthiotransferase RimO [Acidobacteriota bacterium]